MKVKSWPQALSYCRVTLSRLWDKDLSISCDLGDDPRKHCEKGQRGGKKGRRTVKNWMRELVIADKWSCSTGSL